MRRSCRSAIGIDERTRIPSAPPRISAVQSDRSRNLGTKPPYSNQFNFGFRQALGSWVGSVSYNGVRGYRGFTWLSATGICCKRILASSRLADSRQVRITSSSDDTAMSWPGGRTCRSLLYRSRRICGQRAPSIDRPAPPS